MSDDFSPIFVGDVGAACSPQFSHKDGSPFVLTGATISMKMEDLSGDIKICTGTWVIDDPVNGLTHYQYSASDVNTAGIWSLYITITINNEPVHADIKQLLIQAAP